MGILFLLSEANNASDYSAEEMKSKRCLEDDNDDHNTGKKVKRGASRSSGKSELLARLKDMEKRLQTSQRR